jgi:4-hydroxyacetophenone monooxygenase
MESAVDSSFIRQAIELADLNAVRVTLYHLTRDPVIKDLPMTADLDDAGRQLLIDKAVAWLEENAGPRTLPEPPEAELRALLDLATKEETPDLEFAARRDLPAFKDYPWAAEWTDGKPEIPKDFKVAIIGGGYSGIAMGVQLNLLGIPYVLLERESESGGTWNVNRYPDIRVDTSSLAYDYSFEKGYRWTEYFGRGPEVRKYLQYIAEKYGVAPNIRLNRELERATFDETRDVWMLEASTPEGSEIIEANVLVTAVGTFLNPKRPHFDGEETFEGQILHPARWPEDYDATGKRVAIIGNGSTGVQMLGAIAGDAEQVYVFQRTPQWISPRPNYGKAMEPEVHWLMDNFPGYWNWSRYMASAMLFETHDLLVPDDEWQAQGGGVNRLQDELRENLLAYIEAETGGRKDLIDRLIPDYPPYARRAVVDNGWYRALTRSNVELVTDGIARFTPKGIETVDERVREVDTIVTATGFEVAKYLAPTQFKGRGGLDLHEFWAADGPRAYMSMMVPSFPNFFTLYGPNSQPVSGGKMLSKNASAASRSSSRPTSATTRRSMRKAGS